MRVSLRTPQSRPLGKEPGSEKPILSGHPDTSHNSYPW